MHNHFSCALIHATHRQFVGGGNHQLPGDRIKRVVERRDQYGIIALQAMFVMPRQFAGFR